MRITNNIIVKCYPNSYCLGSCNFIIEKIKEKKISIITKCCNELNLLSLPFEIDKLLNSQCIYIQKELNLNKNESKSLNEVLSFVNNLLINKKDVIILSKLNGEFYTLLNNIVNYITVKYTVSIIDDKSNEYFNILTHMPEFMNNLIQNEMYIININIL